MWYTRKVFRERKRNSFGFSGLFLAMRNSADENHEKGKNMNNLRIDKIIPLGSKPLAVPSGILSLYKRAEQNDLDAIFDLSRHYFSFENNTEHLQSALYYKSLLIENYPADYDPYSCAVTMTDIAHILGLLNRLEESKEWFVKAYKYVFENYPNEDRRGILEEIGYFISLDTFGFNLKEIIVA